MDNNLVEQLLEANALRGPVSHLVSEDAVRHRAYEIYVRRGMQDGRAQEDLVRSRNRIERD
jgi:hypothetical protein